MAAAAACGVLLCLVLQLLMALQRLLPRTALLAPGHKPAGRRLHISCSPLDEKCSTFLEEEEWGY